MDTKNEEAVQLDLRKIKYYEGLLTINCHFAANKPGNDKKLQS